MTAMVGVTNHLRHDAGVLLFLGGFCIFGCVAMLMRTGMAKGTGEPIPDDPSADVLTKVGRSIARGERCRVPIYQRIWQLFLAVGILLLISGGITLLASVV